MKLTQRKIEGLECAAGRKDALFFDDEQRGLAIRVTAAGGRNFLAQYTFAGQKRRVPLGACSAISLDAARKATASILGEVAQGRDPAAARKEVAREAKRKADHEALTLCALIEQWEQIRLADRRESYAGEAVRALRFAFAGQLSRPADDLSRRTVVRVLDAMAKDGKIAMASSTAAYGRACFSWAMKRGSLNENPFAALPLAPVEKRDRVLTDDELRAAWLTTVEPGTFNAIVRALILTGQRREEVAGMIWGEIAPDFSAWTLPAERAKNGTAQIIPLSSQMREHLEAQGPRGDAGALVFPGRGGKFDGFGKAKAALDKAILAAMYDAAARRGIDPKNVILNDWRLHDLRRTVATGLQKLGVRLEVTEAVLGHLSGSRAGIVGVYQRHTWSDEKRAALDAWGAHVAAIVDGRAAKSNVTPVQGEDAA